MGLLNTLDKGKKVAEEADTKLATILGDDANREKLIKMVANTSMHDDFLKLIEMTGNPKSFDVAEIEKMAQKYFGKDLSGMDPVKILATIEPALNGYYDRQIIEKTLDKKAGYLERKKIVQITNLQNVI